MNRYRSDRFSLIRPRRTRREFLMASAAIYSATASGTLGAVQAADEPDPASGLIDAHVHVWTPDVKRYPLAAGFRPDQMAPASFTPEELLAHARPCGVTRVVLVQMSFYGFDNTYMLETMRRFPGVFGGIAVIDENNAPADAMGKLKLQGVRGFRIRPGDAQADKWLDTPGMQAMWRSGAEQNLAMCCLINPDALPRLDAMCQKFPETPVVVDHFARIGIDGQIREADLTALCRLARHRHTYVKISAYYALGKKLPPYLDLAPMIRRLYETFGPQRLMWATDCPYQVQEHKYDDSLALVRDRLDFVSAADRQWLLKKTAQGLFF